MWLWGTVILAASSGWALVYQYSKDCFIQEGAHPDQHRETRLCLHPRPLSTTSASYCLSFVSRLFTPAASIMVTVNKMSWILIGEFLLSCFLPSWPWAVNFFVNPNRRFYIYPCSISVSDFNPISQPVKTLLSFNATIYHVNPSFYWVVYKFDKHPLCEFIICMSVAA